MDNHKSKIYRFNEAEFKKNYRPILIAFLFFAFVLAAFFIWYIFLYLPDVLQIHEEYKPFWSQGWAFLFMCFEIGLVGGSIYLYVNNKRLLKRSYLAGSENEMFFFKVITIVPKWQMRLLWSSIRKDFFDKDEYWHYEKIYIGNDFQIRRNIIHTLIITGAMSYEEIIEMDLDLSDPVIVKKGQKMKSRCRIPAAFDQMDEIENALLNFSRK